ncbi:PREDICTED: oncoprotein-induced transcript 3 protein-like [Branchiostoma belcheri]|uniref:Oncoprotein-induced transcript 3 protein-like n=1 Tax=Branchiostoma belcheri TaxID=7741 RepID=A0A6P5AKX6_BRABE|nr:PREDICTED: oncoprotein-induced transcript 3 protein-like [Branchiostoma belcheri]
MEALRALGSPGAGTNGGTDGSQTEKRGEASEKLAAIVRAMSEQYSERGLAGEDRLSSQSRRQNDPCSNYITLSDAWRNVQDVNSGNADRCDSGFAGEWYRFTGSAGNAMPTAAPPDVYRCGTDAPMWMNGQHPTLADGEVSRQACAYWSGNTCNWQTTIQVRACSAGYYVYKLPAAPACSLTYCGSSENIDLDGDDCAGNPCVNGDCVDGRNSYTCNCYAGYEGSNCETNIDDCAANPCVNGDCVDGINTYTCTCNSGYEGDTCDRDVDGCSPDPCDPLATCQDVAAPGTGATCTCPVGYEGDGELGGSGCKVVVPPQELSGSTSCTNDYMELAIPKEELTDIDQNNLHWEPDQNCGATTNGTHYLFRTDLYGCGTKVKFDARYVTFLNTISIRGTDRDAGVISRGSDVRITSRCEYARKQWVDSTFLPIPGGLNFTEEGFGQLEVRLSMFPTRQYQSKYRADQFPIHRKLRENVYMQLEVQGHGQELSVLALNCKATMSPEPNDTLHYQLINDGCASDPTLDIYSPKDANKERFGFEAFRFIKEVKMVYVHCEVMVCDAGNARSRCAEGCVARRKRASDSGEKADMIGRHMLYLGPIVLDDAEAAADSLRSRRGAPWALLAAGGGLMALALVVLGAAVVRKYSRREEWAYQAVTDVEGEETNVEVEE